MYPEIVDEKIRAERQRVRKYRTCEDSNDSPLEGHGAGPEKEEMFTTHCVRA